jgi:hypothetical protein
VPGGGERDPQSVAAEQGGGGKLAEEPFSYRVSRDGKVFISWQGRQVMILKDKEARRFLDRVAGLEGEPVQLAMAKITGNFKRGNER